MKAWTNPKNGADAVAGNPDGNMMIAVAGQEFAIHTLFSDPEAVVYETETSPETGPETDPDPEDEDEAPVTDEADLLVADSVFTLELEARTVAAAFNGELLFLVLRQAGGGGKYILHQLGIPDGDILFGLNESETPTCFAVHAGCTLPRNRTVRSVFQRRPHLGGGQD